jgi:hypothetical protein
VVDQQFNLNNSNDSIEVLRNHKISEDTFETIFPEKESPFKTLA